MLLHAYLEWGEDCVNHFNGIYAFGIWDERKRKRKLMLGRDHLGVKPLFFAQRGSSVIFGSELKALLAHPSVDTVVDRQGIAELFAIAPMRSPGVGVFKDVQEVRSGHYALFTEKEGCRTVRYWTLQSREHTDDAETTARTIRSLLEDAVKRQLIADKPVTTMLSGGLDSSGLTALAGKNYREENKVLQTFSIDFENNDRDFVPDFLRRDKDEPWVKKVSDHVGTDHHTVVISAEQLAGHLLDPMRARDLPGIGEAESSLYYLCKEMKKEATVALSGESADEVFSGYPWFHQEKFLNADIFPWLVNYGYPLHILKDDVREKVKPDDYRRFRFEEAVGEIPFLEGEAELERKQRQMSYLFITRFLQYMLDRKDRASMYTGFEVRVPFCDYRLVEYLFNVPFSLKFIDDIEKGILRRALEGALPDDVRNRRKSAYPSTKDKTYFQLIRDWMQKILDDPNAPIHVLIQADRVREVIEDPNLPAPSINGLMDYLVQVNGWLEEYKVKIEL